MSAVVLVRLLALSSSSRVTPARSRSSLSEEDALSAMTPVTAAPAASTPVVTQPMSGAEERFGPSLLSEALAVASVEAAGSGGGGCVLGSSSSRSTVSASAPASVMTFVTGTRPTFVAETLRLPALTTSGEGRGVMPTARSSMEISTSGSLVVISSVAVRARRLLSSFSSSARRLASISRPPSFRYCSYARSAPA